MHASPTNDYEPLHLSTNDLPAQSRIARWREVVERKMLRVDIDPLSDTPFQADVTCAPCLRCGQCCTSGVIFVCAARARS
jgi:hypothetical protein